MFWNRKKPIEVIKVSDEEAEKKHILEAIEQLKKKIVFDKASFTDDMPADALICNLLLVNLLELQEIKAELRNNDKMR